MRTATVAATAVLTLGLLLPAGRGGGKAGSPQEEVVKDMLATLEPLWPTEENSS